jgi:hypothetical protein
MHAALCLATCVAERIQIYWPIVNPEIELFAGRQLDHSFSFYVTAVEPLLLRGYGLATRLCPSAVHNHGTVGCGSGCGWVDGS